MKTHFGTVARHPFCMRMARVVFASIMCYMPLAPGYAQNWLTNGSVAYYPFNGNAHDESGNGNDGLLNNIGLVPDRFGTAAAAGAFSGSADSFVGINTESLNLTGSFSVSAWVKVDGLVSGRILSTAGYELNVDSYMGPAMNVSYEDQTAPAVETGQALEFGVWHHLLGVWTEGEMRLYTNGVLAGSKPLTSPPSYSRGFKPKIGQNSGSSADSIPGLIDDVRVYNRALSEAEILALLAAEAPPPVITKQPSPIWILSGQSTNLCVTAFGFSPMAYQWFKDGVVLPGTTDATLSRTPAHPEDSGWYSVVVTNVQGAVTSAPVLFEVVTNTFELGMVAYYPFNGNANDESGNGNNGTINGTTLIADRFGSSSQAMSFDGVSQYIDVPHQGSLNFSLGDFTISLWANVTDIDRYQFLMGKDMGPGTLPKWILIYGSSSPAPPLTAGLCFHANNLPFDMGGWYAGSDTKLKRGTWQHVLVRKLSNLYEIYIDGTLASSEEGLSKLSEKNTASLKIGAAEGPLRFEGMLDDIRMYDRALSRDEISELYWDEAPPSAPTFIQAPASQTVMVGSNALFSALANGKPAPNYQWLKDGAPKEGATNNSLESVSCHLSDSGLYSVIASNSLGSVTSAPVMLRVVTNTFEVGMIAYYPFNGNANDESGNANNGTSNDAILTINPLGQADSAYAFKGTGDYISAPNKPYLTFPDGGDFTISIWAALSGLPNPIVFLTGMDMGPGEQAKWSLYYGQSSSPTPMPSPCIGFMINDGGNAYWMTPTLYTPAPGSWHNYLVTKNGTNYTMYIDGMRGASGSSYVVHSGSTVLIDGGPSAIPPGITAPLTIGWSEGGGYFNGKLDNLRIYNRALTSQEAKELHDFEFPDADRDGLSDYAELNLYHTDPNKADTDSDGLNDYKEVMIYHTDPLKPDTDGDGYNDYTEIYSGKDPLNINDHPAAVLSAFVAIELEFPTQAGINYKVQSSPDLINWTDFEGPIQGDGNLWKKTFSTREQEKTYYRVEKSP